MCSSIFCVTQAYDNETVSTLKLQVFMAGPAVHSSKAIHQKQANYCRNAGGYHRGRKEVRLPK